MTPDEHIPAPESPRRRALGIYGKILIPVAIGLAVVAWMFHGEFNASTFSLIHFTPWVVFSLFLAVLAMAGRDFGMAWRFRAITDRKLSWWKTLKVTLLCEFTSAITPSAVGGSAFGMIYLNREGVALGKATTLMFTTIFLDELFLMLSIPAVLLFVPYSELLGFSHTAVNVGLQSAFWLVYGGIAAWTLLLFIGLFIRPQAIRKFLNKLFSFRLLRRWAPKIEALGNDIETTGRDLRTKSAGWWAEVFAATAFSWISRYLVVNALFLAFVPEAPQAVILGRQFVVWVLLMASPTPGGAGLSEWLFATYYGDLITPPGMIAVLALFWRILSYYVYLVIGAIIVPSWVKKGIDNVRNRNQK